ncbi:MAG: undecaprenyl-diphosphate phosphatase [bacterium]|nr:undecaprenyl-diphosphate phosphatase [bacterium]
MEYLQALVLGLTQGITEFIPISSDGHLYLVRIIFDWPDQGLLFDAVLHIGTLFAIIIVLWRELLDLVTGFWHILARRTFVQTSQARLASATILATIPAALTGYFFEDIFSEFYRNALSVGLWFTATGVFYFLVEQLIKSKRQKNEQQQKTEPSMWNAVLIGLAQVTALLPGVSRSGTTIATGTLLGLTREAAARFSFVMATPIIAGASILSLAQLFLQEVQVTQGQSNWGPLALGTVAALLVGVAALKGLLELVKRWGLRVFGFYLVGLGVVVVALNYSGVF